jgi:methyltransferase (TIGR00027 family)
MKYDTPSATANIVARNVVLVASTKSLSRLVPPDSARITGWLIQAFSPTGEAFLRRARSRWFQSLFRLYERITIPGLALHQALRKRHIERALRESLEEGFQQVVILGGGLDSLALRLRAQFDHAQFIELDHPATQRVKQEVIQSRHLGGENLRLLPVDFTRQTLEQCLAPHSGYQPDSRTVFLCEGVLMYLEEREVEAIFAFIGKQPAPRKRFIFTFMEPDQAGKTNFRNSTWLVRLWLSWRKEPFKWGLPRMRMREFLESRGFLMRELATPDKFRELYLDAHGLSREVLAEGENVCVADSTVEDQNGSPDARSDL